VVATLAEQRQLQHSFVKQQQQGQLQQLHAAVAAHAAAEQQPCIPAAADGLCSSNGSTAAAQHALGEATLREALRQLDLAALMGGLRFRPWVDRLINALDLQLQQLQDSTLSMQRSCHVRSVGGKRKGVEAPADAANETSTKTAATAAGEGVAPASTTAIGQPQKHQRATLPSGMDALGASTTPLTPAAAVAAGGPAAAAAAAVAAGFDQQSTGGGSGGGGGVSAAAGLVRLPPGSLSSSSAVIPVEHAPSMEHFMVQYLLPPGELQGQQW
jgi:hypothetical protein